MLIMIINFLNIVFIEFYNIFLVKYIINSDEIYKFVVSCMDG